MPRPRSLFEPRQQTRISTKTLRKLESFRSKPCRVSSALPPKPPKTLELTPTEKLIESFAASRPSGDGISKAWVKSVPGIRGLYIRVGAGKTFSTWYTVARGPDGRQVWQKLGRVEHLTPTQVENAHRETAAAILSGERTPQKVLRQRGRRYVASKKRSLPPEEREKSRDSALRSKYGITNDDYEAILAAQRGRCRICLSKDPKCERTGRFYVDHCHRTNRVRGIICKRCNSILGMARDRKRVLARAIEYLEDDGRTFSASLKVWRVMSQV